MLNNNSNDRLSRALCSLEGLSVGDAFGEGFFVDPDRVEWLISSRALPAPSWRWTDDTQMALSIVSDLRQHEKIDQDSLARSFAERYDNTRGYGPAMHGLLARIRSGEHWHAAARSLFSGQGSFGNGAAMRVAPVGGYFAEDLDAAIENAALSAEITHAHPEAIAGAIAVAAAAARAFQLGEGGARPKPAEFLDLVIPSVPDSDVRVGLRRARQLDEDASVQLAVSVLGNGREISAPDTVPFCLWCAAQRLDNYEEALWLTVSGLGDRDTTCAIVGGIVALYTGLNSIPAGWREDREALPEWVVGEFSPQAPRSESLLELPLK